MAVEVELKPGHELVALQAAPDGNVGDRWHINKHFAFAGHHYQGHRHATDHLTNLVRGTVRVDWRDPDGREGSDVYVGPFYIDMPAERWHRFNAVTDAEWHCIFAAPSDKLLHTPFYAQIPPNQPVPR